MGDGWFSRSSGLLLHGPLDSAEDVGYLAVEDGEFEVDDAAARVEDNVDGSVEGGKVAADGLAHAALNAVAVDRLAHDLSYGKTDAGTGGVGIAERLAVGALQGPKGEEVAHLFGELLAARLIDALVVGVFAQAEGDGCFGFAGAGRGG